jgi:mono/diheme cytochrome c family protein
MKAGIAALAATAALLIAARAFARQEESTSYRGHGDASVYVDLLKAPDKVRAKRNPFENDPKAIAAGRNLFEQHCSECHGHTAEGSKKAPSLRAEEVQSAAPGAIFWVVTNGVVRRGMPVWSKLPEPQRWQLVTFIKSLGPSSPTQPATK